MAIDAQMIFSDSQVVSTTADSTNVFDLSAATDLLPGNPLYVVLHIISGQTITNETFDVALVTDDNAGLTSDSTLGSFPQINTTASAATGKVYVLPWTDPAGSGERYIALKYTVAGTAPNMTFTAYLTDAPPRGNYTRS